MNFSLEKQNALTKDDKSHETKIDEKIISLCNKINSQENFFTTSSCSGRITIIPKTNTKLENAFLFKSHDRILKEEIKKIISNLSGDKIFYFRTEPAALHVACKTLEDAQSFLNIARNAGFKKSGIISSKDKIIIELFSTEFVVAPFTKETLTDEQLDVLVSEANEKLEKTNEKIKRLESVV